MLWHIFLVVSMMFLDTEVGRTTSQHEKNGSIRRSTWMSGFTRGSSHGVRVYSSQAFCELCTNPPAFDAKKTGLTWNKWLWFTSLPGSNSIKFEIHIFHFLDWIEAASSSSWFFLPKKWSHMFCWLFCCRWTVLTCNQAGWLGLNE